jgi:hypothetical protein
MDLRVANVLIFLFAAVGLSLVLTSLYGFLKEVFRWILAPRGMWSRASVLAARAQSARKPSGFLEVDFPWVTAYLITGLVVLLLWLALEGGSIQLIALGAMLAPVLVRRWIMRQKAREAAGEVRQFLVELRLQLSAGGTLRPALQAVAQYGPPNIGRLLRSRLAGQENGAQVLGFLAEDTGNRWIEDIAGRAEAAQGGMLNMDEAVAQSITRVTEEMDTEVREELQKIPTRLIVIVAPLILGPALAVLVYPIIARVLASLQGTGFIGLF